MLPQFYRHIGTGTERPDAVSLPEYGDQSVGRTVLASFGWLSYFYSCLDECCWNKYARGHYLSIYKFYNYISWQFPDISPTGCSVQ